MPQGCLHVLRVAPMMLDNVEADPFLLLVHHRHRFDFWDPIRPIFRLLLPEVCATVPWAFVGIRCGLHRCAARARQGWTPGSRKSESVRVESLHATPCAPAQWSSRQGTGSTFPTQRGAQRPAMPFQA